MKRTFPYLALAAYVCLGAGLLITMASKPRVPEGWKILAGQGTLRWDAEPQKMTLTQYSPHLVLQMGTSDLSRLKVESTVSDSQILLKVDDGNPSRIMGKLEARGSVWLINPNGIIVGPDATLEVGDLNILSTLDVTRSDGERGRNDLEFIGKIRANGPRAGGEVMIETEDPGGGTPFRLIDPSATD